MILNHNKQIASPAVVEKEEMLPESPPVSAIT